MVGRVLISTHRATRRCRRKSYWTIQDCRSSSSSWPACSKFEHSSMRSANWLNIINWNFVCFYVSVEHRKSITFTCKILAFRQHMTWFIKRRFPARIFFYQTKSHRSSFFYSPMHMSAGSSPGICLLVPPKAEASDFVQYVKNVIMPLP